MKRFLPVHKLLYPALAAAALLSAAGGLYAASYNIYTQCRCSQPNEPGTSYSLTDCCGDQYYKAANPSKCATHVYTRGILTIGAWYRGGSMGAPNGYIYTSPAFGDGAPAPDCDTPCIKDWSWHSTSQGLPVCSYSPVEGQTCSTSFQQCIINTTPRPPDYYTTQPTLSQQARCYILGPAGVYAEYDCGGGCGPCGDAPGYTCCQDLNGSTTYRGDFPALVSSPDGLTSSNYNVVIDYNRWECFCNLKWYTFSCP